MYRCKMVLFTLYTVAAGLSSVQCSAVLFGVPFGPCVWCTTSWFNHPGCASSSAHNATLLDFAVDMTKRVGGGLE